MAAPHAHFGEIGCPSSAAPRPGDDIGPTIRNYVWMLTIKGLEDMRARVGETIGTSAWHTVTQDHIAAFASATDDYEEIHLNPERAAQTPFGVTIAHGLYTLS